MKQFIDDKVDYYSRDATLMGVWDCLLEQNNSFRFDSLFDALEPV